MKCQNPKTSRLNIMNQHKYLRLSVITNRLQQILQPAIGKLFWVKAEISSGRERGGSFYCDLVETDANGKVVAKMRCNIWARDLSNIRKKFKDSGIDLTLDNGTEVGFQCSVQYSSQHGLSLKVVDADPAFALGELELRKREILERLLREGLLEPNKKVFVPMLPNQIGLIASKGSAAFNDFIATLTSSTFGFRVFLADSVVQGEQAEGSIMHALETLEQLGIELVVIIRGGGSKVDLHYLDNENIARKIAAYKLPVWTGIGHEIDISVLDHVANRSFKTPTAVAEELIARFIEMTRHLEEATNRFKSTWTYRLKIAKDWISKEKTGIKEGTRKLLNVTTEKLKNSVNMLSLRVNDRLINEKKWLSESKIKLAFMPPNLIKRVRDHLEDKKNRYIKDSKRQVTEYHKYLSNLKEKFKLNKYLQPIFQQKSRMTAFNDQLKRVYHAEMSIREKDMIRLRNRLRREIVLNRIQNEKNKIDMKHATLKASDPKTSLRKGFSLTYKENRQLVKSINDIYEREVIRTEVSDGEIMSTVDSVGGK